MAAYDDNNRVSLWKNDKRETENHPHLTGSGKINNVFYRVAAWKTKPSGNDRAPMYRLQFTVPEAKPITAAVEDDGEW